MDAMDQFKAAQKKGWVFFAPLTSGTVGAAAKLVQLAKVTAGQRVLDVACGTGVVAVTAARRGAQVSGLDLTPELLELARENSRVAGCDVEWTEGDAEALPYADGTFDVVLSQFGHIFAPRPEVATRELLRVLKPGGTLAFSSWPPELFTGRAFALVGRYAPPLPPGVSPPAMWGDVSVVKERLGTAVTDLTFDRGTLWNATLSPAHHREVFEDATAPARAFLQNNPPPERVAEFRREYEALASEYFQDNYVRHDFLMTRAVKRPAS